MLNEQFLTTALPFTFGVPFAVDVTLEARVELEFNDIGTATADLFNTAILVLARRLRFRRP